MRNVIHFVREYWLLTMSVTVLVSGLLLSTRFGCENMQVAGSGQATLTLYEKRAPQADAWQYGDTVVYCSPRDLERFYTGTVVARAGDTVALRDTQVVRNGSETTLAGSGWGYVPPVRVPHDCLWVLGENKSSPDSRRFGPVPVAAVRGRIMNGTTSQPDKGKLPQQ